MEKYYPEVLSKMCTTYLTSLYIINFSTWLYIIILTWKCKRLILRHFIWHEKVISYTWQDMGQIDRVTKSLTPYKCEFFSFS